MGHSDGAVGKEIGIETLRSVREQALRIVNASLEDAQAQHPLDVPQIFSYDRPTLNGTVPIELYRAVRLLAFREILGSKISAAVLSVSGKTVAEKMGVHGIPDLLNALQDFCLAKVTIIEQTDDRLVLSAEECATCAGVPPIGEPICHFESGFIAGALDGELSDQVRVIETRCWGLGDRICRWEVHGNSKPGDTDETDTLATIMELASKAAHAMENGLAVRLKNRELRQAYEQIQESERMKKDLTDMIVHDMRVPVNNFMGSIETLADLMEPRLTAKEAKLLDIARSSGRVLVNMIDDLLDISRLEAQKPTIKRGLTSIAAITEQAVEQVTMPAKRKGINLEVGLGPNLPEVNVDGSRMVRVLVNLLGNAIQYTPAGGMIVLTACSRPDERKVLVSVSDTGEGIPKEHHKRIFDKFVQGDTPRSRKRTSTGLGLTFCKLVTEAHGGCIWVESEPGLGSTFSFTIPVD